MMQPVSADYLYNHQLTKTFTMIDNYVYLYHTDTLIALPMYPDSIQDSTDVSFGAQHPLSRSAPIYSFQHSGPRSFQVSLPLHRDMMNQINTSASNLDIAELGEDDYVDIMINQLQAMAYPTYGQAEKMVNPPMVAVRFGNDIFCKGVVSGSVGVTYSGPILTTNKYALVTVAFTITEVDPYDATTVMNVGGFRGLRTTLSGGSASVGSTGGSSKTTSNAGMSSRGSMFTTASVY